MYISKKLEFQTPLLEKSFLSNQTALFLDENSESLETIECKDLFKKVAEILKHRDELLVLVLEQQKKIEYFKKMNSLDLFFKMN